MKIRASFVPALVVLFATGLAAGTAHAAPTAPNPDKIIRPQTPAVVKTPAVSYHTAALAERHDQVKQDPSKAIPAKLRMAKQEVLQRDETLLAARAQFHSESKEVAARAHAIANPTKAETRPYGPVKFVPVEPSTEQLAQASETYVSAAQLLVSKSGNLSQRAARENPDKGAKETAAKAMVEDYKGGADLYRKSAELEDKRAAKLAEAGKLHEAEAARDKAQNTRVVAASFEKKAAAIEANGVPGADAYTLPTELKLSGK